MTTINANATPPTEMSERIAAFNNAVKAERQLTKSIPVIAAVAATCLVASISCWISGFYLFPSSSGLFLTGIITAKLALVTAGHGAALSASLPSKRDEKVWLGRGIDPVWFLFQKHVSESIIDSQGKEIGRTVTTSKTYEYFEMQKLNQQSSGS